MASRWFFEKHFNMFSSFIANAALMERLLLSIVESDSHVLDGVVNLVMESREVSLECNGFLNEKVRGVTRMLLMPLTSETNILRKRHAPGPVDAPLEGFVISHEDRLPYDVLLLHSALFFIRALRAPPVPNVKWEDVGELDDVKRSILDTVQINLQEAWSGAH